jgi:four helix bundle protein
MATFQRLEDIRVWRLAMHLVDRIYFVSEIEPFRKDSILRNQIRRAVVSISSNIAEGFQRDGNKEFTQFLSLAKGSAGEVISQLYIAHRQHYLDAVAFEELKASTNQTIHMIGKLMEYLRKSPLKGRKFVVHGRTTFI